VEDLPDDFKGVSLLNEVNKREMFKYVEMRMD
jgi:hypothetical protein